MTFPSLDLIVAAVMAAAARAAFVLDADELDDVDVEGVIDLRDHSARAAFQRALQESELVNEFAPDQPRRPGPNLHALQLAVRYDFALAAAAGLAQSLTDAQAEQAANEDLIAEVVEAAASPTEAVLTSMMRDADVNDDDLRAAHRAVRRAIGEADALKSRLLTLDTVLSDVLDQLAQPGRRTADSLSVVKQERIPADIDDMPVQEMNVAEAATEQVEGPEAWIAGLLAASAPDARREAVKAAAAIIYQSALAAGERGEVDWNSDAGTRAHRLLP